MAATLTQERFTGPEWIFERKFDGIRLLAYKNGLDVSLFSRNRLPQNIPSVARAIEGLPIDDLILDGEVTWGGGKVTYHVFDVLWLEGRDVTSLPLDRRRQLLSELPFRGPLERVASLEALDALEDSLPWERAQKEGWEGVIAKRRDSVYEHRRSPHWLKMKCEMSQELVVGGFTDPQGRRVGLGALLVGYFETDDFVFAGKIGTGFDTKLLLDLRAQLDTLEIPQPPLPERSVCRACVRIGCVRRSPCRSGLSNGPCTASCVIRVCLACARGVFRGNLWLMFSRLLRIDVRPSLLLRFPAAP